MKSQTGKFRRRLPWLALALTASVLQVISCALPSLVVCHKGDRPPQVEFFSDSCSCRRMTVHAGSDRSGNGVHGLGESCTDVHLKSHVLLPARTLRHDVSVAGSRCLPGPERAVSGSTVFRLRTLPRHRGAPGAVSPPFPTFLFTTILLRC
jgi:hypothetical protein